MELTIEDVVGALRSDIIFGRLRPRERLVEGELSGRFGVGRYLVRGALDELERQGFVVKRPNKGALVREYSAEEIRQLYEMRALLQEAAVQRMPLEQSEALLVELESAQGRYRAALEERDLMAVVRANDAFHRAMFLACGNAFLSDTIEQFWYKTAAIHSYAIANPDLARRSCSEHEDMILAIRSRDRDALARLVVDHMRPALEAYEAALQRW
ncbi:GntR family transcriptional regulator [Nitratireductor indicus]|uniref:GntR family transcriptional regulator n=1 Tax=Nitratireductor indicus TaxID=721133 RepID=UPI002874D69E|nr:GntR family transcriptional regulator [Nitratireductor indicus]MDS1135151.1 GntR family transcriptional regulator [Nitratireductor indicus]